MHLRSLKLQAASLTCAAAVLAGCGALPPIPDGGDPPSPSASPSVPPSASPSPSPTVPAPPGEVQEGRTETSDNASITDVTVGGREAKEHTILQGGHRAELAYDRTELGVDYVYRWSLLIPDGWQATDGADIVAQWAAYPGPLTGEFPCGGNGQRLSFKGEDVLRMDVQHPPVPGSAEAECTGFDIATADDIRGRWVDFESEAVWTDATSGYFRLWMQVEGGERELVVDYAGPTWWPEEVEGPGPYFKQGYYTGLGLSWDNVPSVTSYSGPFTLAERS